MTSGPGANDPGVALTEVAEVAEEVADAQRRVAREARAAARARRNGATWSQLVESGKVQRLLGSLGAGAARLARAAGRLRAAVLGGLSKEGWTTRRIGARLGISHQRVSALRARGDDLPSDGRGSS